MTRRARFTSSEKIVVRGPCRLRTTKTKGCLSRKTALAMVFKLLLSARKKWRRLNGSDHLAEVIQGVRFEDGIKKIQNAA